MTSRSCLALLDRINGSSQAAGAPPHKTSSIGDDDHRQHRHHDEVMMSSAGEGTDTPVRWLAVAQGIAVLVACTGLTSQYLARNLHVNVPTFQSTLLYISLSFYLIPLFRRRRRFGESLLQVPAWAYFLLALVDVEANFLVVSAYQYTNLTSVMLLDCMTIPTVMALSWFVLHVRYARTHLLGMLLCVAGLVLLVFSDAQQQTDSAVGSNPILGDLLCLAGAVLYALSNVLQEKIVRRFDKHEFLGMLGLFGTLISGTQSAIVEGDRLQTMPWSWPVVGLMAAFCATMFGIYSLTPLLLQNSSATVLNLSLLTSDIYGLVFGMLFFAYHPSGMFVVAYLLVILGIALFNAVQTIRKDPVDDFDRLHDETDTDNA